MAFFSSNDGSVDTKLLLGVAGILLAILAFLISGRAEQLQGVPVMTGYGSDHEAALMDGALKVSFRPIFWVKKNIFTNCPYSRKYPKSPFVVETQRPLVIIPTCCYEELKSLPQTKITFWEFQKKEMLGDYTGIFQHNVALNHALRSDLNRNLAAALNQVEDKISWIFDTEIGDFDGWKSFHVHQLVILIVARLVAGIFVGPRFARDDEWTNLSLGLAVDLVVARDAIKRWPTIVQPIVGPFLPEIRVVNRHISRMAEMLKPVIESTATRSPYDEEKNINFETEHEGPEGSFISWILKRLDTADPEVLARAQVSCKYIQSNAGDASYLSLLDARIESLTHYPKSIFCLY